jgi:DNA polymerase III subunit alpha
MNEFVHLQVHTEYSLLEGSCRINELIDKTCQLGMTTLAITDYATMYGVIPFYQQCKAKGIKPIIGVEVNVINGEPGERVLRNQPTYSLVLLAENEVGYVELMNLVTESHMQSTYGKPRVNKPMLAKYHKNVIAICPSKSGEVHQYLLERNGQEALRSAREYESIFGKGYFYLGLADHGLEEERVLNQRLIKCAKEINIPTVVTHNVHYLEQRDATIHDVLLCIGNGNLLQEQDRVRLPNDQFYLKSPDEIISYFPFIREAIENTNHIANRCCVEIPLGQHILPKYPVSTGDTAAAYLRRLCEKGVLQRYGIPSTEVRQRMDYELAVIEKMGFSDYFLIVWDFMNYAHEQGISTGPGRGSAAGSIIAYLLKITDVDPLKYKLLFERFLNPERVSMPDIDIDFEVERRGEVIEYVSQKYGKSHVAQIITFGTMAARAAIRDVGRVLGMDLQKVDRIAKYIPHGMNISQVLQNVPEFRRAYEEEEKVHHWVEIARGIEGLPRHASTHAAGIVISREALTNYVPLQQGNEGHSLTQYSMEYLEQIGLLKMDFLGLKNLTILDWAVRLIERQTEKSFSLSNIPEEDISTFQLLSKGDTTGIFQLESPGMRNVLKEVKPTCMEDIIAILALFRPGPMEIIPEYVAVKNGRKKVDYLHPDLKPILADTYGFILYQEQIMQIASQMAGYSLGQADVLRRAVSKKKREVLNQERENFIQGCKEKGYGEQLGNQLYDLIVRFADYGYNRSHSAAYSLIAYQMAFLKANYPLEFMSALLTMSIGNLGKIAEYIEECRRKGIRVLPPDINESMHTFMISHAAIRFGLSAIKNVGIHAIQEIMAERKKNGSYMNLEQFCQRVDPRVCNRRVLEALIQCGAMDCLPGHRAQKLAILDEVLEKGAIWRKENAFGQVNLFSQGKDDQNLHLVGLPTIAPYTQTELLELEKELLGLYLSGHPLDEWDHILERKEVTPLRELGTLKDNQTVTVGGMVQSVKWIMTRKGEQMAFALLEDKTGEIELTAFPTTLLQIRPLLKKENLLVITGKVQVQEDGNPKLIVMRAWDMTTLPGPEKPKALFIRIGRESEGSGALMEIQKELLQHKGNTPVFLYYESRKEMKRLQDKYSVSVNEALIGRLIALVGEDGVKIKEWNG